MMFSNLGKQPTTPNEKKCNTVNAEHEDTGLLNHMHEDTGFFNHTLPSIYPSGVS